MSPCSATLILENTNERVAGMAHRLTGVTGSASSGSWRGCVAGTRCASARCIRALQADVHLERSTSIASRHMIFTSHDF